LARELGGLPLALHIVASHLVSGISAQDYLAQFRSEMQALEHAHPGGGSTEADRARLTVRSSFEISWKLWCASEGSAPALQAGLVALAQSGIDSLGDDLGAALADLPPTDYNRLLAGARRLGLLELEAVRDHADVAPRRRLRLHPLMAEFLREKPGDDVSTVQTRLTDWLLPRMADQDEASMRGSRAAVLDEPAALQRWLTCAGVEAGLGALMPLVFFANACGPYGAWFTCFERWSDASSDPLPRARLCWAMALMAEKGGEPDQALTLARTAAELFAAEGGSRPSCRCPGQDCGHPAGARGAGGGLAHPSRGTDAGVRASGRCA
jgi:hypothetical protein